MMNDQEEIVEEVAEQRSLASLLGSSRLPLMTWVSLGTTLLAFAFAGSEFAFYSIGGFSWIIALAFAAMITVASANRITFPIGIWLPWIMIVISYGITSDFANLQRSTMLICPIVVGIGASTARIADEDLSIFLLVIKVLSVALIVIIVVLTGLLITGVLPERTGFAPQAITTLLLTTLFISGYSYGNAKDVFWYLAIACIPIIALTRGPMVVTGLSLPLSFSPIKLQTRMIFFGVVVIAGLVLFFSPRVQKKFFYSGEGTIEDLQDEKKVSTSGRRRMAELLVAEIVRRPVFGHGANASEEFIYRYSRGQLTHPHNDWLRFLYDYGLVGTAVFSLTILVQIASLLRGARRSTGATQILFSAGASSFLSFVLIMFTDNIVLYAAYFGNLQFTVLGLAYAADHRARRLAVFATDEEEEQESQQESVRARQPQRYAEPE